MNSSGVGCGHMLLWTSQLSSCWAIATMITLQPVTHCNLIVVVLVLGCMATTRRSSHIGYQGLLAMQHTSMCYVCCWFCVLYVCCVCGFLVCSVMCGVLVVGLCVGVLECWCVNVCVCVCDLVLVCWYGDVWVFGCVVVSI